VILGDVGVENPEGADDFAADVSKQRVFDFVRGAEITENFLRVVGNRCGIDSVRFQLPKGVLQLDELVAAIGSPVCAAAEQQQQALWTHQIVQGSNATGLIGQREVGNLCANLGSGAKAVILGLDELDPFARLNIRATRHHFAHDAVQDLGFLCCFHKIQPLPIVSR
jgi:hypothetical protein